MTETTATTTKEKKRRITSSTSSRRKTTNSTTKSLSHTKKTETAKSESSKSTRTEIELYCARTDLETALTYVKRGVPQNPHHPLLNHVFLVADSLSNTLELTTNSLDFGTNTNPHSSAPQMKHIRNQIQTLMNMEK